LFHSGRVYLLPFLPTYRVIVCDVGPPCPFPPSLSFRPMEGEFLRTAPFLSPFFSPLGAFFQWFPFPSPCMGYRRKNCFSFLFSSLGGFPPFSSKMTSRTFFPFSPKDVENVLPPPSRWKERRISLLPSSFFPPL